jgi:hypothetical protein
MRNTRFLGDAIPVAWPNLGPEIFSAWCGCGYEFGEDTAWSQPCLSDWADIGRCRFDPAHPLFTAMMDFTDRLLALAGHDYIVGLTDLHPGGDHLAALRDPQRLCLDMIEHVPEIKSALKTAEQDYFTAYNLFYDKLRAHSMPISAWIPLPFESRYYIPSNDFSCMISNAAFEDVFLPGIRAECDFYDAAIYHLDGPGALLAHCREHGLGLAEDVVAELLGPEVLAGVRRERRRRRALTAVAAAAVLALGGVDVIAGPGMQQGEVPHGRSGDVRTP